MSKKLVSLVVGVAAVFALTSVASAATVDELLAQIAALQAQLQALQGGTSTTAYTFTNNLRVGSRGADVEALQQVLIDGGYLTVVSAPTGYFGSATKAALVKWQAANGLPATGYFGPMSRGVLNTASTSTGGNTTGNTTGGTTTTPSTSTPAEGSFTVKLAASPAPNADVRATTNVPVYGLEIKAVGSDITIDRADLQFTVTVGGTAQNPGTFVTGVSVVDESNNVLVSKALTSADFNKDSSNNYWIRVSGIGYKIAKDSTKNLVFRINTNAISTSDTARVVSVDGYLTNSLRGVDTLGLQSYADISALSSRQHTFNATGNSTLTTSANTSQTPKTQNNRVLTSDGVKSLTMQAIDVKSTTGVSKVTDIGVAVNASTTTALPSTLYLFEGSTQLGAISAATTLGGVATFTNLTINVDKDQTKTLIVKADFPTSVTNGLAASTSIPNAGSVIYEKPEGSTANGGPTTAIAGNDQYFYAAVPKWTMTSASITSDPGSGLVTGASSTISGTIVLNVKSDGGSLTKPTVSDFSVVFASSTQTTYSAANSISVTPTITVTPTDATVGDGGEYTVTIRGTLASSNTSLGSSQDLFMVIKDIDSTIGGITITNQTWGIDTFYTQPARINKTT